jgi:hypothetical protein
MMSKHGDRLPDGGLCPCGCVPVLSSSAARKESDLSIRGYSTSATQQVMVLLGIDRGEARVPDLAAL